ncbi:hypothetical protein O9G_000351 [Rozella allomycis CSF55]|uniref:SH3 domain-containing protein n=1 Tax=Rozella allomycis (strain CSF55) TaxID=988480 RepID=A0A075ATK0_ROZAC|nr:hypothetical protein O9G_000351 [Rozella allomycis CSF55]|eukprot:EPZ33576.1 hypothetical protein O9G_000351 [Rozella allomycis CSF55]
MTICNQTKIAWQWWLGVMITKLRALYEFNADYENELSFKANDIVILTEHTEKEWWTGYLERDPSKRGLFPATYVELCDQNQILPDFNTELFSTNPCTEVESSNISWDEEPDSGLCDTIESISLSKTAMPSIISDDSSVSKAINFQNNFWPKDEDDYLHAFMLMYQYQKESKASLLDLQDLILEVAVAEKECSKAFNHLVKKNKFGNHESGARQKYTFAKYLGKELVPKISVYVDSFTNRRKLWKVKFIKADQELKKAISFAARNVSEYNEMAKRIHSAGLHGHGSEYERKVEELRIKWAKSLDSIKKYENARVKCDNIYESCCKAFDEEHYKRTEFIKSIVYDYSEKTMRFVGQFFTDHCKS